MSRASAWLLAFALWGVLGRAQAEAPPCTQTHPLDVDLVYPAERVDLNRADEAALVALPGIGSARARAIVSWRASHGGFRNLSQLLQIKGIGRGLLKRLRPLVTLGEPMT
jgi:competence ComEA-like helix-hairpin-helix protein